MYQEDIVTILSQRLAAPPYQVVFTITMQDVIDEIARSLGEKALDMDILDLLAVRHEVRIVCEHGFDARDYIQPGIDAWKVVRNL